MQRRRQIEMAVGLAVALHVSAAVTTVGYARYRARHSTTDPEVTPVTLEWLTVAPSASDKSDRSDTSDRFDVPTREAARHPEEERPQPVAAKQQAPSAIPPPSALPATEIQTLAPTPSAVESDKSDRSDRSDKSDVPAREVARLPEVERATEPSGGGLPVAATERPSAIGPLPSAAPATDLRTSAVGGPYPVALAEIRPRYPRSARMQGQEGRVVVWAAIDDTGHSERLEVRESSGQPALDEAALDAVHRARFRPATRDGAPVSGEIRLPFEFRLQ